MMKFPCPLLLTLCVACSATFADEKWTLTRSDFRSEPVVLKGLDSSGLRVLPLAGGEPQTIPLTQFLDLSRSLPASPTAARFVLHLSGQDQVVGEPAQLNADALVWKNPQVGEISIPVSQVIAITQPGKAAPSERKHEDVVELGNGDSVHGIIAALDGQKVSVQTANGNSDVPLSSISAVNFAITPGAAAPQHGFRIRLDDGSSLVATEAQYRGNSLLLTLGPGAQRQVDLSHVTAIEQVNGPVSWLSARPASEALYQPFIGPPREPAAYMNRTWGGTGEIEFAGRRYAHGIGVHAYSRLSWPLDGSYAAFRTQFAIEGESTLADVTVRIRLDDRVVFEKQHIRAGWLSPVIIQELGGAKKLTLDVDGSTGYPQDSLDWIEPALLRQKPAPAPAPATEPASQPSS